MSGLPVVPRVAYPIWHLVPMRCARAPSFPRSGRPSARRRPVRPPVGPPAPTRTKKAQRVPNKRTHRAAKKKGADHFCMRQDPLSSQLAARRHLHSSPTRIESVRVPTSFTIRPIKPAEMQKRRAQTTPLCLDADRGTLDGDPLSWLCVGPPAHALSCYVIGLGCVCSVGAKGGCLVAAYIVYWLRVIRRRRRIDSKLRLP